MKLIFYFSDMTIKVHNELGTKSFNGHTAPVLSVALDPNGKYKFGGLRA